MTNKEFSNGFDTLLNSYASRIAFGDSDSPTSIEVDEYEKSLSLTNAQTEIVVGLYNGRNPLGEGFEQSEELRRYLAPLVKEHTCSVATHGNSFPVGSDPKVKYFTLPDDCWFITLESVDVTSGDDCRTGGTLDVYPVRQDEYHKIKRNPFRGANYRRALRLDLSDGLVEIVADYTIKTDNGKGYHITYIRKPKPIILADLDGLEIDGYTFGGDVEPQENSEENKVYGNKVCELPDVLHQKILERAVAEVLKSKGYNINNNKDSK